MLYLSKGKNNYLQKLCLMHFYNQYEVLRVYFCQEYVGSTFQSGSKGSCQGEWRQNVKL